MVSVATPCLKLENCVAHQTNIHLRAFETTSPPLRCSAGMISGGSKKGFSEKSERSRLEEFISPSALLSGSSHASAI